MTAVKDFTEDVALLLEGGFVAIKYGDRDGALNLFNAAQILAPDRVEPKVGLATLALNQLDLEKSIKLCSEVLEQDEKNYQAMVICGMSYILQHKEAEKASALLTKARDEAEDEPTQQLAELWLAYLDGTHETARPLNPAAKERISKELER